VIGMLAIGAGARQESLRFIEELGVRNLLVEARPAGSPEEFQVRRRSSPGLTERDVTPEATATILEREAEGIAEALRAASGPSFPRAWLSRGRAGTRGKTLIVNLPGSTNGVKEGLAVLDQFVQHAVDLISGTQTAHG